MGCAGWYELCKRFRDTDNILIEGLPHAWLLRRSVLRLLLDDSRAAEVEREVGNIVKYSGFPGAADAAAAAAAAEAAALERLREVKKSAKDLGVLWAGSDDFLLVRGSQGCTEMCASFSKDFRQSAGWVVRNWAARSWGPVLSGELVPTASTASLHAALRDVQFLWWLLITRMLGVSSSKMEVYRMQSVDPVTEDIPPEMRGERGAPERAAFASMGPMVGSTGWVSVYSHAGWTFARVQRRREYGASGLEDAAFLEAQYAVYARAREFLPKFIALL